jgi:hypothetical protein
MCVPLLSHRDCVIWCLVPCVLLVQTPDSKKEEFRKYLEKSGVIDALTKGARACACPRGGTLLASCAPARTAWPLLLVDRSCMFYSFSGAAGMFACVVLWFGLVVRVRVLAVGAHRASCTRVRVAVPLARARLVTCARPSCCEILGGGLTPTPVRCCVRVCVCSPVSSVCVRVRAAATPHPPPRRRSARGSV